jgi:hypothetical protein
MRTSLNEKELDVFQQGLLLCPLLSSLLMAGPLVGFAVDCL